MILLVGSSGSITILVLVIEGVEVEVVVTRSSCITHMSLNHSYRRSGSRSSRSNRVVLSTTTIPISVTVIMPV